jgi:hypothetical protein
MMSQVCLSAVFAFVNDQAHSSEGVTCRTMRPPFGDIDDRVRAVLAAMDMTPIIWYGFAREFPARGLRDEL